MSPVSLLALLLAALSPCFAQSPGSPLQPLEPDENTCVLYHFDEGEGTVLHDASPHGNHAELRGPQWSPGKFGGALWFDGEDDCVFREVPDSIRDLKQITVECWANQEHTGGRRFMAGQDVGFHFELDDGSGASISLYNKGGGVPNAEGKPHQQVASQVGSLRPGRWHHVAITYDGRVVSFFINGVLKARREGPADFSLGAPSRGLWLGCYVGMDYWFNGLLDEFRVSNCVRYDPDNKLGIGEKVFEMPESAAKLVRPAAAVREPKRTGEATLRLTLRKRYGGNASGWVYLKPPGKPAVVVGEYALKDLADGAETSLDIDVTDEFAGDGRYILGLEQVDTGAYFALTQATLSEKGEPVASWEGEVQSRRTFGPPVLAVLDVGAGQARSLERIVLLPGDVDRVQGAPEIEDFRADQPPCIVGEGHVEWWFDVPIRSAHRVYMRYASAGLRPCDIVVDGVDVHPFHMGARNSTGRTMAQDAFWEYQGTVTLEPGPHWLRIQNYLPDMVALRLDPVAEAVPARVPWNRFRVPGGDFLSKASGWVARTDFGKPEESSASLDASGNAPELHFATRFANTADEDLFAGDAVRFVHDGAWDLEPFGRLSFEFRGQGTGHVVALWLVDAKGDEKLLWRRRDNSAEPQQVSVPLSFEGNSVFDPGRVSSVCVLLDEANMRAGEVNDFGCAIVAPRFERRDVIAQPDGYAVALQAARTMLPDIAASVPALLAPAFRPWTQPVVPEEHPLFATTEPKPVTRGVLGDDLHFTGARDIAVRALDDFHAHYDFGDICWPHIGILPQRRNYEDDAAYAKALEDMEERLREVRRRNLILWDIWGYVPFGEAGPTPRVEPEHHEALLRVFGDRFLGYDNGEQDGRYIGAYADRGLHTNRKEGWEDFVRWDEGICNDSMNFVNATGSLNFSHYYGERGARTLGLETAQGLPSDTLMFAFLRGAGKQYGRLLTQATSIWNRYGYNMYHDRRNENPGGYGLGPNKGCSLSLHRRLFFQSYSGGDSIVGSETSQFTADRLENGAPELSPLGAQHLAIKEWVKQHPDRGVMHTPVAFMLDFYNGWNMPRHLYRGDKYKIWGKLPYEKGDYLIDGMFRMIWPGYEDCSYLRNERGFITPTPFGDIFDVLNNRCHPDIIHQYQAIMLLGDVELTPEVIANLRAFAEAGGDLITDAKHARQLPGELTGVTCGDEQSGVLSRRTDTGRVFAEQPYTYTVLALNGAQALLVNERGHALMTVNAAGQGRVIVGAADYWMTDQLVYSVPELVNMEPPYTLLKGVQSVLSEYFESFSPVTCDPGGLNFRVNCFANDPKHLLVSLTNNELFADWDGTVTVRLGEVAQARELWRDAPVGMDGNEISLRVPAGDVAVVDVRVR